MFDQLLDFNEYLKLFAGLIAIVDPIGVIPIYLGLIDEQDAEEKKRTTLMGIIGFIITLLVFNFFGEVVLDLFAIQLSSFRVAGGILLMILAMQMLRAGPSPAEQRSPTEKASVGIVPLAIPILAGPGAISTIIVYGQLVPSIGHKVMISGIIIVLACIIFIALRLAPLVGRLIGKTGMVVFNRIMGLIIAAISIEFIASGLLELFPGLM